MDNRAVNRLLKKVQTGGEDALASLYEGMAKELYYFVLPILNDKERAADIVQDTFLSVIKNISGCSVRNGRAWIYQIAKNLSYNALKRAKFEWAVDLSGFEGESTDGGFHRVTMQSMLKDLSEEDKQIVLLKIISGFTYGEISLVTKIPVYTLKRRLKQILEKLKETS